MEARNVFAMNRSKKGALILLAVVVFWTAMPAFACLLSAPSAGKPSCCRAMAHDCGEAAIKTTGSCCQIQQKNAAISPAGPYSPEQPQKLTVLPRRDSLPSIADASARRSIALEAPPPKVSPGAIPILRI
jgi:hypothetical protein